MLTNREEQLAVFNCLREGVLLVDADRNIVVVNRAAAQLAGIKPAECQGKRVDEVIPDPDIRQLVTDTLEQQEKIERKLSLNDRGRETHLDLLGAPLCDDEEKCTGAVIVMNDVTALRRIETVRRDFTTNISHELNTPVTTIKGFVETLLDGGMNDPAVTERLLRTVADQVGRLNAIVADLLLLSRIENEADLGQTILDEGPLRGVLLAAVRDCEAQASRKEINVELLCDENTVVRRNAPLLERAAANLIDNAIEFSETGGKVAIEVTSEKQEVLISVRDNGCGVEKQHLSRLIERFYRVDEARSRDRGGSGLGLAIVKHITRAHGGDVTVTSEPDHGSTFSIRLPEC